MVKRQPRQFPCSRASGQDDVWGSQRGTHHAFRVLYRHRTGTSQTTSTVEHLNLVLAHQKRHAFGEAIGDLTATADNFFKIESDIITVEPEFFASLNVLVDLGVVEQGFGGNATPVEADAAEGIALDKRHL